jgi:hypothetical protein
VNRVGIILLVLASAVAITVSLLSESSHQEYPEFGEALREHGFTPGDDGRVVFGTVTDESERPVAGVLAVFSPSSSGAGVSRSDGSFALDDVMADHELRTVNADRFVSFRRYGFAPHSMSLESLIVERGRARITLSRLEPRASILVRVRRESGEPTDSVDLGYGVEDPVLRPRRPAWDRVTTDSNGEAVVPVFGTAGTLRIQGFSRRWTLRPRNRNLLLSKVESGSRRSIEFRAKVTYRVIVDLGETCRGTNTMRRFLDWEAMTDASVEVGREALRATALPGFVHDVGPGNRLAFLNSPPASYRLLVLREGHAPVWFRFRVTESDDPETVIVVPAAPATDWSLTLRDAGSGHPVGDALVLPGRFELIDIERMIHHLCALDGAMLVRYLTTAKRPREGWSWAQGLGLGFSGDDGQAVLAVADAKPREISVFHPRYGLRHLTVERRASEVRLDSGSCGGGRVEGARGGWIVICGNPLYDSAPRMHGEAGLMVEVGKDGHFEIPVLPPGPYMAALRPSEVGDDGVIPPRLEPVFFVVNEAGRVEQPVVLARR